MDLHNSFTELVEHGSSLLAADWNHLGELLRSRMPPRSDPPRFRSVGVGCCLAIGVLRGAQLKLRTGVLGGSGITWPELLASEKFSLCLVI